MRSSGPNTVDHSAESPSEGLRQKCVQYGIDAGVAVRQQMRDDLQGHRESIVRILLHRPAKKQCIKLLDQK